MCPLMVSLFQELGIEKVKGMLMELKWDPDAKAKKEEKKDEDGGEKKDGEEAENKDAGEEKKDNENAEEGEK